MLVSCYCCCCHWQAEAQKEAEAQNPEGHGFILEYRLPEWRRVLYFIQAKRLPSLDLLIVLVWAELAGIPDCDGEFAVF